MRVIGLDLSKTSTGWAVWGIGDARAAYGHWELGSAFTSNGMAFARLHERLSELNSVGTIDAIFFEEALNPTTLAGFTNIDTLKVLSGLCAHAESWGEAMGCRVIRGVNQSTWRKHFLGPVGRPKNKFGKPIPVDWKALSMARARDFGMKPQRHDEAEAIGILSFALDALGISPPWQDPLAKPKTSEVLL
ncbi:hypothetical protein [Sphingomonas sp.]|uniref:hypothetical protein n=1 Tax=Sphingomonas sp. TaxID=28214 RepID=UPI0035A9442B